MTTYRIDRKSWKIWTARVIGLLAMIVMALWAFNTVAELMGAPIAQYKHAVAAFALLLIVRWVLLVPKHRTIGESRSSI